MSYPSPPDDLGTTAVDVNYLNVGAHEPDYQLFMCWNKPVTDSQLHSCV